MLPLLRQSSRAWPLENHSGGLPRKAAFLMPVIFARLRSMAGRIGTPSGVPVTTVHRSANPSRSAALILADERQASTHTVDAAMQISKLTKQRLDNRDRREGRRLHMHGSTSSAAAALWFRYGHALSSLPEQRRHPSEYKDFDFALLAGAPHRRGAEPQRPTDREYRKMRQSAAHELKLLSIRTVASMIAEGRFARLSRKEATAAMRRTGRGGRPMFINGGGMRAQVRAG